MTKNLTLLAQLSNTFNQHPELVATEALGHILAGSEPAREALRAFLQAYMLDIGKIATVETEKIGDELERPDLACSDQAGNERLLIEAKFWAGLTGNQPVTYLRRLRDTRASALLVVAPFLRFEELWPELKRRVSETDDIEWTDGGEDGEVRWASTGKHRLLMLASWRHVLDRLATRASAAGEMQSTNDIQQLKGLADLQDSEAFLPLRAEQLGPEFPRLHGHLLRLFYDATDRIVETGLAVTRDMKKVRFDSGRIQYMELGGFNSWFGTDYDYWFNYRQTPLWFGFQQGAWSEHEETILSKIASLRLREPPKFIEAKRVIPITLLTGVEYNAVLDDVVSQLKEIAELLQSPQ
ncbi:MAG: hypothetical protein OXF50_08960 [Caldilineaceae bacterium]|nr:hypothetical protein [Caldilineaceae bacterium]